MLHLSKHFFHCSKQFLSSLILMPFSASVIFCFTSSTSAESFPLRTFFSSEEPKKCHSGQGWVIREGEAWGSCRSGQKLLNTQCDVSRCARKSSVMKWANLERVFKKNSLKLKAASHNNARWYTDTDGFLEHSPSRGSLCYRGRPSRR